MNQRVAALEREIRADIKQKLASKQANYLTPMDTAITHVANFQLRNNPPLSREEIKELGEALPDQGLTGLGLLSQLSLIAGVIPKNHPDEDPRVLEDIKRGKIDYLV